MIAEIDHLFILCEINAPEASALIDLRFEEGSCNSHPHQGTACRRFFFQDSYLELLWVHNPEEAQSEPVRSTGLGTDGLTVATDSAHSESFFAPQTALLISIHPSPPGVIVLPIFLPASQSKSLPTWH